MTEQESEKVRSAGVRQEDRLLGLDTAGIVKAAKAAKETDSTFRVFRREWLHQGYYDDETSALEYAEQRWGGRVREGDVRVIPPNEFSKRFALEIRLWNVKAEIKRSDMAQRLREEYVENGTPADDVVVVARNSRREHELAQFGVLKLAT